LGFEEVDKLEIPLEENGGEGAQVHGKIIDSSEYVNKLPESRLVHMIRKPKE